METVEEKIKDNYFVKEYKFVKLVKYEHKNILVSCEVAFDLDQKTAIDKLKTMNLDVILSDKYELGLASAVKLIKEQARRKETKTFKR